MNRPVGVSILSVLYYIVAVCFVMLAAFAFAGMQVAQYFISQHGISALVAALGIMLGFMLLVFAGLAWFVGYGLWTLREWARIVAIVLAGLGALSALVRVGFALAHIGPVMLVGGLIRLAIDLLIIWYLVQPQVRAAFARGEQAAGA